MEVSEGTLSSPSFDFRSSGLRDYNQNTCQNGDMSVREGFARLVNVRDSASKFQVAGGLADLSSLLRSIIYSPPNHFSGIDFVYARISSTSADSDQCSAILDEVHQVLNVSTPHPPTNVIMSMIQNISGSYVDIDLNLTTHQPTCIQLHASSGSVGINQTALLGLPAGLTSINGNAITGDSTLRFNAATGFSLSLLFWGSQSATITAFEACDNWLSVCLRFTSSLGLVTGAAVTVTAVDGDIHVVSDDRGLWCAAFTAGVVTVAAAQDEYDALLIPVDIVAEGTIELIMHSLGTGRAGQGTVPTSRVRVASALLQVDMPVPPLRCSISSGPVSLHEGTLTTQFALDMTASGPALATLSLYGPGIFVIDSFVSAASKIVVDANPLGLIWRALGVRIGIEDKQLTLSGDSSVIMMSLEKHIIVSNATIDSSVWVSVSFEKTACENSSLYYTN